MKKTTTVLTNCILIAALLVAVEATPVSGQDRKDRSWADRLDYVGVAVEEPGYHVWGSSPVVGPAGKTHLFVARWPLEHEFKAWLTHSEIARYVSDNPAGPFTFQEVVVRGSGKEGTWDFQAPHNPNIQKVGDRYVLTYIANAGGVKNEQVASQRIGMMIADRPEGPWKTVGDDGLVLAPPADPSIWSYRSTVGVNNPALLEHPDGRFFLYYKAMKKGGIRRMGVAIADRVEGPYAFVADPLTSNSTTIEDGYAFVENGKVYLLTTHNNQGTGYLWESDNGIDFSDPVMGYDKMHRYLDQQVVANAKVMRGRKFERPQVLVQDGKPTYLYVASGANLTGGNGSHSCVFRIKAPKRSRSDAKANGN
ncbi:glycoside hydrolase family protein [Allorhodopirellula solitaria]|uniref:Glycosyl hydrolases family 43 n=1 Tax=Allorhodopirellula solitaria TaxID=2527987 RepID=A0A5C5XV80_9BACT|nr:glycoside hydrolase family protein [Allorhodopirellula solitaria]TWT67226.1 Glycosyl hydrolases family 43 [Allorhodopirellula solitaria]